MSGRGSRQELQATLSEAFWRSSFCGCVFACLALFHLAGGVTEGVLEAVSLMVFLDALDHAFADVELFGDFADTFAFFQCSKYCLLVYLYTA